MQIIYHHRTRGKGAEGAHIMGVVTAFRDMGHRVSIISMAGANPENNHRQTIKEGKAEEKNPSLITRSVYRLTELTKHMPEILFECFEVLYNLVAYLRLRKKIISQSPDFIYERYSLFMFAGVLIARQLSIPIIIEINDSAVVERVRPLFLQRLAKKIESWVVSNCDGIVFISENFRNTIESNYEHVAYGVICPNAVNSREFYPIDDRSAVIRKSLGLEGRVVCGYVGAFVYWHGINTFIDALAPKLKAHPHLALLLIGDGDTYGEIKKTILSQGVQNQVVMTGRVPHDEVRSYIGAMDYGILPDSNEYGSPMKLFEMMAVGVPLVSPGFEPIIEVVEDNKTGWLFTPKDMSDAVDKVLALSHDLQRIYSVGNHSSDYIRKERQWINNVEMVLTIPKIHKLLTETDAF